MEGKERTESGLRSFREWAIRVATAHHNPDWVMPIRTKGRKTSFVFTLDAYNYYREHSNAELPEAKDIEQLCHVVEEGGRKRFYHKWIPKMGMMPVIRPSL